MINNINGDADPGMRIPTKKKKMQSMWLMAHLLHKGKIKQEGGKKTQGKISPDKGKMNHFVHLIHMQFSTYQYSYISF